MEHSAVFYKIKTWYEQGHWTIEMVKNAVKRNIITEDEYKEIIGENE